MEKPREKLEKHPIDYLENQELVALLLGRGSKKESVFEVAKRIADETGFYALKKPKTLVECQKMFGLKQVHAGQILAAFELGKRLYDQKERSLRNMQQVYSYLKGMEKSKKEICRGIYLSSGLEIVCDEVISIGSLDKNIVHPREVLAPAIRNQAFGFILAHNHPSGNPQPSDEDIKITLHLQKAAKMLQISFLDHVIIAKKGCFSFNESGLLTGVDKNG